MDRATFVDRVRLTLFSGRLTPLQTDGLGAILDAAPPDLLTTALAYCLATAYHETWCAMQPVIESQSPRDAARPTVDEAIARLDHAWAAGKMSWVRTAYWRKDPQGLSWLGRGLPQCTFKANYAKAEALLGVPLTKNPDLALDSKIAPRMMFGMMSRGLFTGKRLSDYFTATHTDYVGARRIINGLQDAALVQKAAVGFYQALVAAGYQREEVQS